MAPNVALAPIKFSILFFLVIWVTVCSTKDSNERSANMVVYFQDVSAGPNATVVPVAGLPGKVWTFTSFGTVFSVDDPITQYPDPNSPKIGRAQGIFVTSSLDGSNAHVSVSIVFTNVEYNGSTLELQGTSRQFERFREVSVVSGTGIFRFARGYVVFETVYFDAVRSYAIVRCNITLLYN